MAKLSEHFTVEEMTFSDYAARRELDNTPDETVTANLTRLCNDMLEPIRELLGEPLHVNSGYRSPAVNVGVGGVLPTASNRGSQHLYGEACDFKLTTNGGDVQKLAEAYNKIKNSDLQFHQLIFEANSWIHVSIPPDGWAAKRQCLLAVRSGGAWKYTPVEGDLSV
jgi:hypothetical protein